MKPGAPTGTSRQCSPMTSAPIRTSQPWIGCSDTKNEALINFVPPSTRNRIFSVPIDLTSFPSIVRKMVLGPSGNTLTCTRSDLRCSLKYSHERNVMGRPESNMPPAAHITSWLPSLTANCIVRSNLACSLRMSFLNYTQTKILVQYLFPKKTRYDKANNIPTEAIARIFYAPERRSI